MGFFNSISIVVKIITSIVSSKAIALFLGPSGLGFLGVFKEFFNMTINVSSLGLQRGVVKYSSELKNNKNELSLFINTTMLLGGFFSLVIGLTIYFFSGYLNSYLFPSHNFTVVFKILGTILPLSVLSNFLIFILNGLGFSKVIIRINILLYILNMLLVVIMSYYYNTVGALLAISFVYVLQFVAISIFKPQDLSLKVFNKLRFSNEYLKKIMGYTFMTITSLVLFPFISILIRQEIINLLGETAAGLWEGMKRISENYLLFASSLIMLSVLPKLSESDSRETFREVVFGFLKSIIPFFIIGLVVLYIVKDYVVMVFYSNEFLPMNVLFKWYLIGDLFRVLGMVLAANFYARRNVIGYIITDMFLALIMYFSTIILLKSNGLDGGGIAYFISYLFYFILLLLIFGKKLFPLKKS
ncbi:O-antigen translocase [Thalassobellus sediminis]|uniref:O-antigen translocase n=1 Tax=Thalassobellus sediminis TaxID=3367753 RepID=UPI003789C2BB